MNFLGIVLFLTLTVTLVTGKHGDSCATEICDEFLTCHMSDRICRCLEGMQPDGDMNCVVKAGQSCVDNTKCLEDGTCVDGTCECDPGYLPSIGNIVDTICFKSHGTECAFFPRVDNCHFQIHLLCEEDGMCGCRNAGNDTEWSSTLNSCVGLVGGQMGCAYALGLCTDKATCENGQCVCQDNYSVSQNGRCQLVYDAICEDNEDVAESEKCNMGEELSCSEGKCRVSPGGTCTEERECVAEAECSSEGICEALVETTTTTPDVSTTTTPGGTQSTTPNSATRSMTAQSATCSLFFVSLMISSAFIR